MEIAAIQRTMLDFKRILVPVDFSDFSHKAVERLSDCLTSTSGCEFHLLYVWAPPVLGYDGDPFLALGDKLSAFAATFDFLAGRFKSEVRTGHPATEICDYAKTQECDLIALATHGRTGLQHLLIGSTAENVVRHAPCPVLTLRGNS